jgi:pilus assembly protein CpaE
MMIEFIGFSNDGQPIQEIEDALLAAGQSVEWFSNEEQLHLKLAESAGALVFLKHSTTSDIYYLCRDLSLSYPLSNTILMMPSDQLDLKRAMRSGAVDAVALNITPLELTQMIDEASKNLLLKLERHHRDSAVQNYKEGRIITVCSSKGGVGKTVITVNLATALAKKNRKVAVVDLDLEFGDVAIMLDEKPKRTIYDWIKEEYDYTSGGLERYMVHHSSGVDFLSSPARPEFAEVVGEVHITELLSQLKKTYDFIIIDTPPALPATVIAALEQSDEILLVTSMDLPTIKNCRLYIETLESLSLKDRLKVILNREAKVKGLDHQLVANMLGVDLFSRIPNQEKIVAPAVNCGIPFVISNVNSAASKRFVDLANSLAPEPKKEPKKGWLHLLKPSFKS